MKKIIITSFFLFILINFISAQVSLVAGVDYGYNLSYSTNGFGLELGIEKQYKKIKIGLFAQMLQTSGKGVVKSVNIENYSTNLESVEEKGIITFPTSELSNLPLKHDKYDLFSLITNVNFFLSKKEKSSTLINCGFGLSYVSLTILDQVIHPDSLEFYISGSKNQDHVYIFLPRVQRYYDMNLQLFLKQEVVFREKFLFCGKIGIEWLPTSNKLLFSSGVSFKF